MAALDELSYWRKVIAMDPKIEWRCHDCCEKGKIRVSASGGVSSFFDQVKWRHQERSPKCEGEHLVVPVPQQGLPSKKELRERRRKLEAKLEAKAKSASA